MTFISLSEASVIYECAETVTIRRRRVACPPLATYSRILRQLRQSLGEESQSDYWREVIWRASWYRYLACSAPLPLSHPALRGAQLLSELDRHLAGCEQIAPNHAPLARQLLHSFRQLLQHRENPLLDEIVAMLDFEDASGTAILVSRSHLIDATQRLLDRTPVLEGAEVIHFSELRTGKTYDRLFVVGAAAWYGPSVFSAPRAPRIDALRYSFVRDGWLLRAAFDGSLRGSRWPPPDERVDSVDEPTPDVDEVEPRSIDVQYILAQASRGAAVHSHEAVPARLLLLEGDFAVFLESDKDSQAFVIDLGAEGPDRIRRLRVSLLDPGMFLLLRTGGGGDYIVPIADRLMGAKAATARASLNTWKLVLRNRVKALGPGYVATELTRRGGVNVHADDVRRWISPITIGTNSQNNFLAIMRYTGLERRAEEHWDLMRRTQTAHKQAGQVIRQLLEQEVEKADLRRLQKCGIMDFELPGQDAGSLTAYRVEEILPETIPVLPSRLSRPFKRGDTAWLI